MALLSSFKPQMRFDTLPRELLKRIAAYGSAESTLSLSRTSRALRSACHDWMLYRSFIECNDTTIETPWKCPLDENQSVVDAWALYALAQSKLSDLLDGTIEELDNDRFLSLPELWAPQLILINHPVFQSSKLENIILHLINGLQDRTSTRGQQFCATTFVASMTYLPYLPRTFSESRKPHPAIFDQFMTVISHTMVSPLYTEDQADSVAVSQFDTLAQTHGIANAIVFALMLFLKNTNANFELSEQLFTSLWLTSSSISSSSSSQTRSTNRHHLVRGLGWRLPLPLLANIPYGSLISLPGPFHKTTMARLPVCHLPAMATATFLASDSCWVGMQAYTRDQLHSAALGARFEIIPVDTSVALGVSGAGDIAPSTVVVGSDAAGASAAREQATGTIQFSVQGTRSDAGFQFYGTMVQNSGRIIMRSKSASNANSNNAKSNRDEVWYALMTPFGIVGSVWYNNQHQGWVWLWKYDWSDAVTQIIN